MTTISHSDILAMEYALGVPQLKARVAWLERRLEGCHAQIHGYCKDLDRFTRLASSLGMPEAEVTPHLFIAGWLREWCNQHKPTETERKL